MNLAEKFEKGKEKGYQRIDPDYSVDIFVGYNQDNQMSMVITEPGKDTLVKSSKLINVMLKKRKDNKMALSFDLLDSSYQKMFLLFCKDIILVCNQSSGLMAIETALIRWKYWREMFGKRKNQILEPSEIKGLIGELLVLRDDFMKSFDVRTALQSWMGPLSGHKDFEVGNTWYEVKSVDENAVQVKISSLEQLESEVDGHLVIVRLEKTNSTSAFALNLNEVVESVTEIIKDPDDLALFVERLDAMGYVSDPEYEKYNFEFKGKQSYMVSDEFPRIRRCEIHKSIGNAEYTILLDGIDDYKEALVL